MRKKLKPISNLKKQAWRLFSLHIRKKYADWRGYVSCYTCAIKKPYKEMQAGHYIHNKLDFDERNIKPQCPRCNMYLSGNLGWYAELLIKENGQRWMQKLRKDATEKGNDYKREELEEIIQKYK